MLLETENEPTAVMTQEQCDAVAERIAAVLRERKKIAHERRMREREYQRRNNDCALARYYKERVEVSKRPERRREWGEASKATKQPERRIENIDVAYGVMMSCNAAIDR
jgi:hypothetical protein